METLEIYPQLVSFRGIGKALVSEQELDKSINEAKNIYIKLSDF